jgi:hypothetical protein
MTRKQHDPPGRDVAGARFFSDAGHEITTAILPSFIANGVKVRPRSTDGPARSHGWVVRPSEGRTTHSHTRPTARTPSNPSVALHRFVRVPMYK